MNKENNLEQGQVALLFMLAVVALLGFAALSIDGGRLYFQKRAAQSAADDAAMTGALAIANGYNNAETQNIIYNRTKDNGFDNALDGVDVEVYWPPIAPNPYAGDMNYIQVFITSDSPVYFAQLVYKGDLKVTVEAIAHVEPPSGIVPGYAIYGTSETACKTVWFHGNPIVELSGGGSIGSNSDADCNCDVSGGSLTNEGNITVDVIDDGEITAVGCWGSYGNSGSLTPEPITPSPQIDPEQLKDIIPIPDCGGLPNHGSMDFSGPGNMVPGLYENLRFNGGADVTLAPGLYCIYGNDPYAVTINAGARVVGHGVMFYLMTTSGGWKTNGGAYVELDAPNNPVDPYLIPWEGMLIYRHPDNTSEIILSGNGNSYYEGTVYALGSHCSLMGTAGGVGFQTNVFCDTVEIGGDGDLDIVYREDLNYKIPAVLDLSK
jgi:hypothetical protein